MQLTPTEIPGVVIVEPTVFGDERGWFMETFNEPRFHAELAKLGLPAPRPFVQDNHSCSRAGVLRGPALPGAAARPGQAGARDAGRSLGRGRGHPA